MIPDRLLFASPVFRQKTSKWTKYLEGIYQSKIDNVHDLNINMSIIITNAIIKSPLGFITSSSQPVQCPLHSSSKYSSKYDSTHNKPFQSCHTCEVWPAPRHWSCIEKAITQRNDITTLKLIGQSRNFFFIYQARTKRGLPSEARAFNDLRTSRYHTRTLQFNWGHENVHIGKS